MKTHSVIPPSLREGGWSFPKIAIRRGGKKFFVKRGGIRKRERGSLKNGWDKTFFSKKLKSYLCEN